MGWTDLFACFRCAEAEKERQVLVAPARLRGQTISSQDGYGSMSMDVGPDLTRSTSNNALPTAASPPRGVTNEQRAKMTEISRTAGSHMRPIGTYLAAARHERCHSPILRSVSNSSSRDPSPSPPRPLSSPPSGAIGDAGSKARTSSDASRDTDSLSYMTRSSSSGTTDAGAADADGVVRKSIFGDKSLGASRRTTGPRRTHHRRTRKRSA